MLGCCAHPVQRHGSGSNTVSKISVDCWDCIYACHSHVLSVGLHINAKGVWRSLHLGGDIGPGMLDASESPLPALVQPVTSTGPVKEPALAATSNTRECSGFELLRLRAAALGGASIAPSASMETLQR